MTVDVQALRDLYKATHAVDRALVSKLPKGKGHGDNASCNVCGGWHKQGMFHLDYVGHADVTRLLIEADPTWTWTPMAVDDDGLPKIIARGQTLELWITLTVHGRTIPAVGTCESGKAEASKELIGDALRNGAMRFGVALDLWSKSEASDTDPASDAPPAAPDQSAALRAMNALSASGIPDDKFPAVFELYHPGATSIGALSDEEAMKLVGNLGSDSALARICEKVGVVLDDDGQEVPF